MFLPTSPLNVFLIDHFTGGSYVVSIAMNIASFRLSIGFVVMFVLLEGAWSHGQDADQSHFKIGDNVTCNYVKQGMLLRSNGKDIKPRVLVPPFAQGLFRRFLVR